MNEPTPSDDIRLRTIRHLQQHRGTRVTQIATETGIGYHKLLRWIKGETVIISYNDAVKLEEYLSRD